MLYHHSRDPFYRSPAGALPGGSTLRLRLLAGEGIPEGQGFLRLWTDHELRLPLTCLGAWQGAFLYEVTLEVPLTPVLLWYRFEWDLTAGGQWVLGNAADGLGGEGLLGSYESFQITVYDPAFAPPPWLREGVMYQAMVDRFCPQPAGGRPHPKEGTVLHEDWYEPPYFVETDNGDNLANDFYGGTLAGLSSKLPYLRALGVSVLYLNPVFEARSNHKYDVGDYHKIDPMFGSTGDFEALCRKALALGIRVLLDGVFSHVGADSRYFNREGRYDSLGAYQSELSPYAPWFTFASFPDEYVSWWGFDTLPEVSEMEPSYLDFTLEGSRAVVPYWLRKGASGWRLDVADELPMPYLRRLRAAAKAQKEDAVVLGEVWEDASHKIAYGEQRSYVLGDTLDSVMNYPLRDALIEWVLGSLPSEGFVRRVEAMGENYPKPFLYATMNLLGSHDRARILNVLGECTGEELPRSQRRGLTLSPAQLALARDRLLVLLRLLLSLPGIPCVFYGDEAGVQGAADPFCRGTYPWGREDRELLGEWQRLLNLRRGNGVLQTGELALFAPARDVLVVRREIRGGVDVFGQAKASGLMLLVANRAARDVVLSIPAGQVGAQALRDENGHRTRARDGRFQLTARALGAMFYKGEEAES